MARFQELECFVAVVETGSITAAADRLELAKSAVSRRLAALEKRLSVQLLNRTTRAIDLTNTGRAFYERAVAVLSDLAEAESAVAQERGTLSGVLRLALPLSFSVRHMGEPLSAFLAEHPEVQCQIDLNDRRVDLVAEGVDLALRIGVLEESTLVARKLFDASATVCASPNYLERRGTPTQPSDLLDHDVLVYANTREPEVWSFTEASGARIRAPLRPKVSASNGDLLSRLAEQGQGIIQQPTFMLDDALRRGALVPILRDYQLPVIPAHAVYPHTRHLSFRVRAFIDHLVAWFANELPWDTVLDRPMLARERN
ncbi:MAG: LysR family transcriptional regulator [Pseudomonadota bacterium]